MTNKMHTILVAEDEPDVRAMFTFLLRQSGYHTLEAADGKEAVDIAAAMLKRGEHRDAILALLTYMATDDIMPGVREKAQTALTTATQQVPPPPPPFLNPADARHMHPARCKNGHVTYFDKRVACVAHHRVPREPIGGSESELDELHLPCGTCPEKVVVHVDCREYRRKK